MMKEDYIIVKNAVSKELCDFMALEYEMQNEVCKVLYPGANLADMCDNTFARYAPLMFEALMKKLAPLVSEKVGFEVYPVYSYARIYYNGSDLGKHFDRSSSEVSVSVAISKEEQTWPLFIKNEEGKVHEINLDVGDIVIYSGRRHEHWREPYTGQKVIQAFLQYVNASGPYRHLKNDTRPCLGLPSEFVNESVKRELEEARKEMGFNRTTK